MSHVKHKVMNYQEKKMILLTQGYFHRKDVDIAAVVALNIDMELIVGHRCLFKKIHIRMR